MSDVTAIPVLSAAQGSADDHPTVTVATAEELPQADSSAHYDVAVVDVLQRVVTFHATGDGVNDIIRAVNQRQNNLFITGADGNIFSYNPAHVISIEARLSSPASA